MLWLKTYATLYYRAMLIWVLESTEVSGAGDPCANLYKCLMLVR